MGLIFICDIDETIADTAGCIDAIAKKYNLDDRGLWTWTHVEEFAKPENIKNAELIPGAEILPSLARTCGAKLVFLTGRSSTSREATISWLKFKLNIFDSVPIIMRENGDMSEPTECKINMFKNTVLKMFPDGNFIFFDDDERLLLEYSKYGLALQAPQCWQTIKFSPDSQLFLFGGRDEK